MSFDPRDTQAWARAFARHVYTTGGPLREAPKHAQRAASKDGPAIKTWGDVGRRMFPNDFDRELEWWEKESGLTPEQATYVPRPTGAQSALLEAVAEVMDVGDEMTIWELCQMLRLSTGDAFWTDVNLHAMDLHYTLAIAPERFQRAPARHCSVKNVTVKPVWRRVA